MKILNVPDFFPDHISHGFFGRQGGVSQGLYDSLNCSPQSRDDPQSVTENRRRVMDALNGKTLSTLKQIHSLICYPVEQSCMQGIEEGDALVTRTEGQIIACLTADCGPVLFYGEDADRQPVIGAAHAGWGGALKGVLESTVQAMRGQGALLSTIRAAIGPCLAQENYEVGSDFRLPFVTEDARADQFFSQGQGGNEEGKLLFNLQGYLVFRLERAGVQTILTANTDTYANENDYFSYRRATHRQEPDYGRQISAICIRKS